MRSSQSVHLQQTAEIEVDSKMERLYTDRDVWTLTIFVTEFPKTGEAGAFGTTYFGTKAQMNTIKHAI